MNRRSFLKLGGLVAAPYVITTPGLLMPVRNFSRGIDAEYLRRYAANIADMLINPPLVEQRIDLVGMPYQIHQYASMRGGVHIYEYAQLEVVRPSDEVLDQFKQISKMAFERAMKKDGYL